MNNSTAGLVAKFIHDAGTIAACEVRAHYNGASFGMIDAILQGALSLLHCESAQAILVTELEHLSENTRSALLNAIADVGGDSCDPAHCRETTRSVVSELIATVEARIPAEIAYALSRLDLVLTLGQVDDHQALVRCVTMREERRAAQEVPACAFN